MTTVSIHSALRTRFLAVRPAVIAAPRDGTGNPRMSAATTGKRDRAASQVLAALLRSFSAWAA